MATAVSAPDLTDFGSGGYFLFEQAGWDLYDRVDAWAGERSGVRLVYLDGDLVVMGITRRHDWYARRLGQLIWAVCHTAPVACEDAGSTTFREAARRAGAQADESFYFGANAERMRGAKDVTPGVDPVPDLVIEVQVGNPPDRAIRAWARLRVPEVWHFDATRDEVALQILQLDSEGESYRVSDRSRFLPLSGSDVLALVGPAMAEGAQAWLARLPDRVSRVLRPGEAG